MKRRLSAIIHSDLPKDQEVREVARIVAPKTHFTHQECEAILKLHANMVKETPLDRMQFRSILFHALEISHTFILDRIFRVCDKDDNGIIDGVEFLMFLSTVIRGTMDEMMQYCYDVYDVNGDRSLARDELFMCLEGSIRPGRGILDKDELEDTVKDIVEIAMKQLDVNRDGQIDFDDFKAAVRRNPLLLQVCGACLPSVKYSRALQCLFTWDYTRVSPIFQDERKVSGVSRFHLGSIQRGKSSNAFSSRKPNPATLRL